MTKLFSTCLVLALWSGVSYARTLYAPAPAPELAPKIEQAIAVNVTRMLAIHNAYRSQHHVPPLTWNAQAAAFAQNWAARCVFQHSGSRSYGENLYLSSIWQGEAAVVTAWYSEIKYYNYARPTFSPQTGHATQVLWKSTTSVGCAVRYCPNVAGFGRGYFVQCDYSPPGNVLGQFAQNVLPK